MVGRGRLDHDARKREWVGLIELGGRDVHHVLAGHVRPRLPQDVDHRVRAGYAADIEIAVGVTARAGADNLLVEPDARVVGPPGIARVLEVARAGHVLESSAGRLGLGHVRGWVRAGVQVDGRRPPQAGDAGQRRDGDRRSCEQHHGIDTLRLELADLRRGVGGGRLVAFLVDDHRRVDTKPISQPLQIVLAVVVVLVQDADLRVRVVGEDVFGEDMRLDLIRRNPAYGPWELAVIGAPGCRPADYEELRYLVGVHVFTHRSLRLSA